MPEPIVAFWEALPDWDTFGVKVLAALLLLGIAVWGWVRWPKRVAARLALDDLKARADVEDNYRKTVGQALAGIVVLLGAGFAYLQFLQQQRAAHDLLISNQVSKGFELLGSKDKDAVVLRLGGIYALEGVMNGSEQYHQAVLEALCAFVREGAKRVYTTSPTIEPPPPFTTDIQAALTVIGRRTAGHGVVDLNGALLFQTNLSGANLSGAHLYGTALSGASLKGADLTFARLVVANLRGADLRGADLRGADLTDAEIDQKQLDGACGSGVTLPPGLTLKPCPPQSLP